MPLNPRDSDEIFETTKEKLEQRIDGLDNFGEQSFNNAFLTAHSEQVREAEIKAVAASLAGSVEYAGRDLTESDLDDLGLTTIDPEEINLYMDDSQLDRLALNFGIRRDAGERASTTVEFEVSDDSVEIEEGTVVSTSLSGENQLDFLVDVDGDGQITTDPRPTVSPDAGSTTVTTNAIADEVGSEYNVAAGAITSIPIPRPGVQSVINTENATGGSDQQSNESLREDVQTALFTGSGGGTTSGISGYIESETSEEISSIGINEFTDQQPPFVDVIVDGGDKHELLELIDESKPPGIEHNLVRPTRINIVAHTDILSSSAVDTDILIDAITSRIAALDVGDNLYHTALLQSVLGADINIISGPSINVGYGAVKNDQYRYYSEESVYEIEYGPLGVVTDEQHVITEEVSTIELLFRDVDPSTAEVIVVAEEDEIDLVEGDDYDIVDGRGTNSAIELYDVSYTPPRAELQLEYEHNSWTVESVESEYGESFTEGSEYELIDTTDDGLIDSIKWLVDPVEDGERFQIEYEPRRDITTDVIVDNTALFTPSTEITASSYTVDE